MVTTPSRRTRRQLVFAFDEGGPETRIPEIRGGKGAYLAEMVAMGLPVPPGFTVTTTLARAFAEVDRLPLRFDEQFDRAIGQLEQTTGKRLGDPSSPLLVSVRSGAAASMPGMMDTILNVGLNPTTVEGLARLAGERFAWDSYRRFLALFGRVVMEVPGEQFEAILSEAKREAGVTEDSELSVEMLRRVCEEQRAKIISTTGRPVPDDPREQIEEALIAVLRSWNSERAVAYRAAHALPRWKGTAVNIQAMVFGNHGNDSGTGVVFSHDVATGQAGLYGEFLPNAQGEDVVAGVRTPHKIAEMKEWAPSIYWELDKYVAVLVEKFDDIVDVEFTVEKGRLFLLQVRRAKRTPLAAVTFAVHQVWERKWTRKQAIEAVSDYDIESLSKRPVFETEAFTQAASDCLVAKGFTASPGAAIGRVALTKEAAQKMAAAGEKVVLVRQDTSPDDLPGMLVSAAIVTSTGGATSHAAVVARELNLPAVVGVEVHTSMTEGMLVSVDGTSGTVVSGAVPMSVPQVPKEVTLLLRWRDQRYEPKLAFELLDERVWVNTLLNDFYVSDAMAVALADTTFKKEADELRSNVHFRIADIFVVYLSMAVAGELRHALDASYVNADMDAYRVLKQQYGVSGYGTREIAQSAAERRLKTEAANPLCFFENAEKVFREGLWHSGYGGICWANIAAAGKRLFNRSLTPTLFVDHVFDLRHNGGKLFDKHPMVGQYVDESVIFGQLNAKKHTFGIVNLHDALLSLSFSSGFPCLSPEVRDLWERAQMLNLF